MASPLPVTCIAQQQPPPSGKYCDRQVASSRGVPSHEYVSRFVTGRLVIDLPSEGRDGCTRRLVTVVACRRRRRSRWNRRRRNCRRHPSQPVRRRQLNRENRSSRCYRPSRRQKQDISFRQTFCRLVKRADGAKREGDISRERCQAARIMQMQLASKRREATVFILNVYRHRGKNTITKISCSFRIYMHSSM